MMKRLLLALPVLLAFGCDEPRIDATSEETARSSMAAVLKALPSGDQPRFQAKLMASVMSTGLKKFGLTKGGKLTTVDLAKPFHGMTAREVIASGGAK